VEALNRKKLSHNVLSAQQELKRETGAYATEMNKLTHLVNQAILEPFKMKHSRQLMNLLSAFTI
jgi:hypothetical protein